MGVSPPYGAQQSGTSPALPAPTHSVDEITRLCPPPVESPPTTSDAPVGMLGSPCCPQAPSPPCPAVVPHISSATPVGTLEWSSSPLDPACLCPVSQTPRLGRGRYSYHHLPPPTPAKTPWDPMGSSGHAGRLQPLWRGHWGPGEPTQGLGFLDGGPASPPAPHRFGEAVAASSWGALGPAKGRRCFSCKRRRWAPLLGNALIAFNN